MTPLKELLQQTDRLRNNRQQDITITEDIIKELHRTALADCGAVPSDSCRIGMAADSYRTVMPADTDYEYQPPQPEDIPRLTGHLTDQIRSSKSSLHPIELAAMAGKRLIDIQPFDAANEETAVLLMNLILVSAGYPPVSIGNERREAYQQALIVSRKEYDMEPFSRLIAECVLEHV